MLLVAIFCILCRLIETGSDSSFTESETLPFERTTATIHHHVIQIGMTYGEVLRVLGQPNDEVEVDDGKGFHLVYTEGWDTYQFHFAKNGSQKEYKIDRIYVEGN